MESHFMSISKAVKYNLDYHDIMGQVQLKTIVILWAKYNLDHHDIMGQVQLRL